MVRYRIRRLNHRYPRGKWLQLSPLDDDSSFNEEAMLAVQDWCRNTGCGTRMSFDMFKFKTKQELELFLLRWS
jgi:hypothetical protein